MKKIALIWMLITTMGVVEAQSQCNLPYKPFKEFKDNPELMNDTLSYLDYNFKERRHCYIGKTLADVIKDMEIPVKAYSWVGATDGYLYRLELWLSDDDYIRKGSFSPFLHHSIDISIEDSIKSKGSFSELGDKYPRNKWVPEHYEAFKNLRIKAIGMNEYRQSYLEYFWKRDRGELNPDLKSLSNEEINKKLELRSKELKEELVKSPSAATQQTNLRSASAVDLKKKDFQNLDIVPIEAFSIDKKGFSQINSLFLIEDVMKPDTDKTVYYASKDKQFIVLMNVVQTGEKWEIGGYEKVSKEISETISNIYFNKQYPVYVVHVDTDSSYGVMKYLVYLEKGNFRIIKDRRND